MTKTASEIRQEQSGISGRSHLAKTDPPSENRVWGFSAASFSCTRVTWSNAAKPHQETAFTATTSASGICSWLSKDPIGIAGGLNQYVAFGNNPVGNTDPSGEIAILPAVWLGVRIAAVATTAYGIYRAYRGAKNLSEIELPPGGTIGNPAFREVLGNEIAPAVLDIVEGCPGTTLTGLDFGGTHERAVGAADDLIELYKLQRLGRHVDEIDETVGVIRSGLPSLRQVTNPHIPAGTYFRRAPGAEFPGGSNVRELNEQLRGVITQ